MTILSKRQHEIALLLMKCMTHKEIAKELDVEPSTINSHIDVLREKLRNRGRRFKTKKEFLDALSEEFKMCDYLPFDIEVALNNPTRIGCSDNLYEVIGIENRGIWDKLAGRQPYPIEVKIRHLNGDEFTYQYNTSGMGRLKSYPRLFILPECGVSVKELGEIPKKDLHGLFPFPEALDYLLFGGVRKIKRKQWVGKHLTMGYDSSYIALKEIGTLGTYSEAWRPSQSDILAKDWELV